MVKLQETKMQKLSLKRRFAKTLLAVLLFVGVFFSGAGEVMALGIPKVDVTGLVEGAGDLKSQAGGLMDSAKDALGGLESGSLMDVAKGKLAAAQDKFDAAQGKFDAAKNKLNDMKSKLASIQATYEKAQAAYQQAEENLQKKEGEYGAVLQELNQLKQEASEASLKLPIEVPKVPELPGLPTLSETLQKSSEVQETLKKVPELPESLLIPRSAFEINASFLRADAVGDRIAAAEQRVAELDNELATAKEDLKTKEAAKNTASEDVAAVEKEVEDAEKEVEESEIALEVAKGELEKAKSVFEVGLQTSFARPPDQFTDGKSLCAKEYEGYYDDGNPDKNGNIWFCAKDSTRWQQVIRGADGNEILESYAAMVYKWLAGFIGVVAVLMMVVGGIQISTAGANQEGLQSGKDRIYAAFAGLALLFLASLILYTINPNFFGGDGGASEAPPVESVD